MSAVATRAQAFASVAERLRSARLAVGVSQERLGAQCGVSGGTISKIESGSVTPDLRTVRRMAEVLGIDAREEVRLALREQLPEEDRALIDGGHAVARDRQARLFDFEVDLVRATMTIDWNGSVMIRRTVEGLRPLPGREVKYLRFRDRARSAASAIESMASGPFAVTRSPAGLAFDYHQSLREDGWRTHEIRPVRPWRRADGSSFSFIFDSPLSPGFTVDPKAVREGSRPSEGVWSYFVKYHLTRLELEAEFPEGFEPDEWLEPWAWYGDQPMNLVDRNLEAEATCAGREFSASGNRARLVVVEPLASLNFAIVWRLSDLERFEAMRRKARESI